MAGVNFYLYSVGSLLLTIGMLSKEFHQREQFYPTIAHIVKSKGCNLVCTIITFINYLQRD